MVHLPLFCFGVLAARGAGGCRPVVKEIGCCCWWPVCGLCCKPAGEGGSVVAGVAAAAGGCSAAEEGKTCWLKREPWV